jgi:hypothetical protein
MADLIAELEGVVRLAEKATPGPWLYRPKSNSWHKAPPDGTRYSYGECILGMDSDSDDAENGWDEQFLIAAVQFMSTRHAEIAAAVRSLQRVKAMRDEWERDVQEHLCRFGQPLPASVECLIEKLDTAMRAGEG